MCLKSLGKICTPNVSRVKILWQTSTRTKKKKKSQEMVVTLESRPMARDQIKCIYITTGKILDGHC